LLCHRRRKIWKIFFEKWGFGHYWWIGELT
jgi:hypothetical protein